MKPPDKLSLIVFSGDFERVHYALALASAQAAINRPVTLFFTMGGVRALGKADNKGAPGWAKLATGPGRTARARDRAYGKQGVAQMEELIAACNEMGVTFMVCEMGLRAEGLTIKDLRPDIAVTEGGIVSFLNDASRHGAVMHI